MRRMKLARSLIVICVVALISPLCQGAEPAKVIVGKAKASWSDLPGVDDQRHSLGDLKQDVVVVAITCNHCPIAVEYFSRLNEFVAAHKENSVGLVAISLSNWEADKLPRMKQLAEREGFAFPYLHDESQQIGKDLGATVTPQFFVLNRDRTLVYRGPWDDNLNPTKVKNHYVEDAVKAALQGKQPAVSEVRAVGCGIKYGE